MFGHTELSDIRQSQSEPNANRVRLYSSEDESYALVTARPSSVPIERRSVRVSLLTHRPSLPRRTALPRPGATRVDSAASIGEQRTVRHQRLPNERGTPP